MDSDSEFRTVRGYQLQSRRAGSLTSALEDYLEMTYRLCIQHGYARVGKLSELLHVKPSSASKMILKLSDQGYLESERYDVIRLTEKGRSEGAFLLDRHDKVERFLNLIGSIDPLGETELIEHSLSPSTVSDLSDLLAFFREEEGLKEKFDAFKRSGRGGG
jgi:Mn-dependent DtxR family transcriptional regulator